jgi:excisionase family DNA binding protein
MGELLTSKEFEPLMTVQQVAIWLNMSVVWVYKQAEKGLLPFHRVGDAIRFDPNEIQSYLDGRRNIKKTYDESRNPKTRKKGVHLQRQQEVTKTG